MTIWRRILAALAVAGAACLAIAGGLYLWQLQRELEAEAYARADAEASRLEAEGQVVVRRATEAELRAQLARLEAGSAELAAALERARRAAPGARTVAVVSASTGPVAVEVSGHVEPAPCLLAPGDRGELRVREVVLETRAGSRLLVGSAEAWRLDPPARLFAGGFEAPLTEAASAAEPSSRASAWGAGLSVWVSPAGLAYGALVAVPPLRVWRLDLEGLAGLGVGTGGVVGQVGIVGRVVGGR